MTTTNIAALLTRYDQWSAERDDLSARDGVAESECTACGGCGYFPDADPDTGDDLDCEACDGTGDRGPTSSDEWHGSDDTAVDLAHTLAGALRTLTEPPAQVGGTRFPEATVGLTVASHTEREMTGRSAFDRLWWTEHTLTFTDGSQIGWADEGGDVYDTEEASICSVCGTPFHGGRTGHHRDEDEDTDHTPTTLTVEV